MNGFDDMKIAFEIMIEWFEKNSMTEWIEGFPEIDGSDPQIILSRKSQVLDNVESQSQERICATTKAVGDEAKLIGVNLVIYNVKLALRGDRE